MICVILTFTLLLDSEMGNRISSIVTIIIAVIGADALFVQFQRDKKINEASFILDLSYHFFVMEGTKQILDKLNEYVKGNLEVFDEKDYSAIVTYCQWLEELAVIVNQNLIDFEFIDDLLSYRFFLLTNNKYIQDIELIRECEFYRGIYRLHKSWTEYKKKRGLPILQEETSLSKTKNYDRMNKKLR